MNKSELGTEMQSISFYSSPDTKNDKTLEIKYTLSGSLFKTQLPIFREGSTEEVLISSMNFTNPNQNQVIQITRNLRVDQSSCYKATIVMSGTQLRPLYHQIPKQQQLLPKDLLLSKKNYIPEPLAIDNQCNYLQRVRKNDKLSVPQFLDKLKHINMLISQFPKAKDTDIFTRGEIKKIFYHSMPARWRTNFINLGQNVKTTSLDNLRAYMV